MFVTFLGRHGQSLLLTLALALAVTAGPILSSSDTRATLSSKTACSSAHPNPVVLLHGLGATYYEDINLLETFLQQQGFCTFALTYGAYPNFPYVGGLTPIETSAVQIAAFINQTLESTGASKVDLVGHSEGAFQSLYVPKFTGVAPVVDKIVAIAPPTHGTTFGGLYTLTNLIPGNPPLLSVVVDGLITTLGCAACAEILINGSAVEKLDAGPIVQAGNTLTVIASQLDELVTPTDTAFVYEPGVTNLYVQDYCSSDDVGHLDEGYDPNVWNLVRCALEGTVPCTFTCVEETVPF
jgi:pimeloyl-ACP methyl ester carboxylesterase